MPNIIQYWLKFSELKLSYNNFIINIWLKLLTYIKIIKFTEKSKIKYLIKQQLILKCIFKNFIKYWKLNKKFLKKVKLIEN